MEKLLGCVTQIFEITSFRAYLVTILTALAKMFLREFDQSTFSSYPFCCKMGKLRLFICYKNLHCRYVFEAIPLIWQTDINYA